MINNNLSQCSKKYFNHAANVKEENYSDNPIRFEKGYKATNFFLEKISLIRDTPEKKIKTILLIDADRGFIQGNYSKKGVYFEKQKKYLIDQAKKFGFTIVDLEESFTKGYKNGNRLNSTVDWHWNEFGHK